MGAPNTGKTASLEGLSMQSSMMYLNFDLKELSFLKDTFLKKIDVANATDVLGFIDQIESSDAVSGVVLDTLTFAMSMYERQNVAPHAGTAKGQQAWGNYANFYDEMTHKIKAGSKNYIVLAHDKTELDEESGEIVSKVPVKGAVGRRGVEADYTYIVRSVVMPVRKLKDPKFQNDLLTITEEEEEDGVKYVFQTRPFKGTGNTCRSPKGTWGRNELFIDASAEAVMKRIKECS